MSGPVIFLLALMIGGSQACRCAVQPLDVRYCNSDVNKYAIVAKVTAVGADPPNNFDVIYTLSVTAIFRDIDKTIHIGENFVKTSSSSASCGVTLQEGNTYLLAGGKESGGDLRLNSCTSVLLNLANTSFQQFIYILSLAFNPEGLCTKQN